MPPREQGFEDQRAREGDLLAAVGRGDVEAMRELYRGFERPLYTLGRRWLRDPNLAEELVQEVTIRIWRRAKSFDPARGAAGSWIFGVARNVAADLANARAKAPIPVEESQAIAEPWDEEGAWTAWEVSQAIKQLPLDQQKVVELAYVVRMTQVEIADTLGVPLGTVKTRLYSALRKLKESLAELDLHEEASHDNL
ncbi:MAG: sigma-70 family RNA polymerase sigma factor [Actinomycetota bacterium]|nr:sigma-70 family RNA polymerase sigma factor [Actinomycetota bacterium]